MSLLSMFYVQYSSFVLSLQTPVLKSICEHRDSKCLTHTHTQSHTHCKLLDIILMFRPSKPTFLSSAVVLPSTCTVVQLPTMYVCLSVCLSVCLTVSLFVSL